MFLTDWILKTPGISLFIITKTDLNLVKVL